jgi:hypothetical protein
MAGKSLRVVGNRGGRPRKLANAVANGSEREILVILRRQIAVKLDEGTIPLHTMHHLVKQLRDFDKEIRAIDARAAAAARAAEEEASYDDYDAGWDASAI